MVKKTSSHKEEFAKFFENPSRENLREIIKGHLGETSELDFKGEWPEPPKLAKHILGMANTKGGCIIFGLNENMGNSIDPVGLTTLKDKADFDKSIRKFLPPILMEMIHLDNFHYEASEYPKLKGKSFQVLYVHTDDSKLPFLPLADGDGIGRTRIYVRRLASTDEATYEDIQNIINRRLETGHSTQTEISLDKNLSDLKILYEQLERYRLFNSPLSYSGTAFNMDDLKYGQLETYGDFLRRIIDLKKNRIIKLLVNS